jgi:hypothetical protein
MDSQGTSYKRIHGLSPCQSISLARGWFAHARIGAEVAKNPGLASLAPAVPERFDGV